MEQKSVSPLRMLLVAFIVLPFSILGCFCFFILPLRFTSIDQYGYIDRTGKWAIAPKASLAIGAKALSEGLIRFRADAEPAKSFNYKWGYMNKAGQTIIAPKYKCAWTFHDGLGAVSVNDKIGYIDGNGKFVIEPQFEESRPYFANSCYDFSEGRATVEVNEKCRLIDKSGKVIVEREHGFIGPFSEHLAVFIVDRKLKGYLDLDGNVVIKPQFDKAESFSEGLAAVHFYTGQPGKWEWGFIDKTGKVLLYDPNWGVIGSFHEGLASIRFYTDNSKQKWASGFINKAGQLVIGPIFGQLGSFHGGLAIISTKPGSHGYIDKSGKIIIPEQCQDNLPAQLLRMLSAIAPGSGAIWASSIDMSNNFYDFHEGLAAAPVNSLIGPPKWGFIDKSGKWVIQPQFALPDYTEEGTGYFEEGLARVGMRK